MNALLESILEYVREHWIEVLLGAALAVSGWYLGKRRARTVWRKREFLDRLNISLNVIEGDRLLIRTLIEKSCAEIFLNAIAVDTVNAASRQTSEDSPLLPLPEDDYWYYLNAVLNEVSEKFADGQIRRDMGLPVHRQTYLICLTSECAGAIRSRKVRAMVIQKQRLESLPAETPTFERPSHSVRWRTLQQLAAEYRQHPHKFMEVEICL